MTDDEIDVLMEVQYLKGRLDELHKAIPTVTNMQRSRKLDLRLDKYYSKLKAVSEQAYYLYLAERKNIMLTKEKTKKS